MNVKKDLSRIKTLLSENKFNGDVLINNACFGCGTIIEEVKELMMSPEDLEDLKNGLIPFESLKLHVKVWCEMGKPDQNRSKNEKM